MLSLSVQRHCTDVSSREKESDELLRIVYGSVTRYGPRTSCPAKGVNARRIVSFCNYGRNTII